MLKQFIYATALNDARTLYDDIVGSFNVVVLLIIVLVLCFSILIYIFFKNRNNKVIEIVGDDIYKKLFMFKKAKYTYQKAVNNAEKGNLLLIQVNNIDFLKELYGTGSVEKYASHITRKLSEYLMNGYKLGRISLSEFIVYSTESKSAADVRSLASGLCALMKTAVTLEEIRISSNFSMGVSSMVGKDQIHKELLRRSRLAMWYSKRKGENTFTYYSAEIDEKFIKESEIRKDLGKALANGEFEMYYQPVFNSIDGSVYSMEALIRWNHPEKGLLKPDYFIQEAEKNDLIIEIGYWVIEQSFKDYNKLLNSFERSEATDIKLSINISPNQLEDSDFVDNLKNYIIKYNIEPDNIVLEITEQVYIQETLHVNELLRDIKQLGCKIAFDDFGIQYSTLSKLNELIFDVVKIDRDFILGIPNDLACVEIIKMLVSITDITKKQLIAEGVDSEEQIRKLNEYGCNKIQGFYYSRPVDIETVISIIHSAVERLKITASEKDGMKEESLKNDEITDEEKLYRHFFKDCPMPLTFNKITSEKNRHMDFHLLKMNNSFSEKFCMRGELLEGKPSAYAYPDINDIRRDRIREAVKNNKNIRFPVYYTERQKRTYDLHVIPLGGDTFAMAFLDKAGDSDTLHLLHNTKKQLELSLNMLDVALDLGEIDIWEYDIPKRRVSIRWHQSNDKHKEEVYAIEDYFEMIHPDDKTDFRKDFLEYLLENLGLSSKKRKIFIYDYRLKSPNSNDWKWVRTNFRLNADNRRYVSTASAINIVIEKHKEYENEIEYRLKHDSLTGMLNRIGLKPELETWIGKKNKFALGIIDIDNFRQANESGSHSFGNKLLVQIAGCIKSSLPDESVIARLSGDEFLVMFGFGSEQKLKGGCRKLIKKANITDEYGNKYSASLGIAVYPDNASDASGLMTTADCEMEKVKKNGKNNYSISEIN